MLQLMKPYCSHSFRCQFSNRRCSNAVLHISRHNLNIVH